MAAIWKIQVLESGEASAAISLKEGGEAILGRDPTVDLVLIERSVSRRHCRLRGTEEGVHVKDLGSANGTYMAGRRIKEALLKPGEEAQIGLARVIVSRASAQTGLIPIHGLGEESETPASSRKTGTPRVDATVTGESALHGRTVLEPNKQAYQALEKERLALLIEAGKSLSSSIDLNSLLEKIMDHLFQILPVRRGALALLTSDGSLEARCTRPDSEERELSRFCSQNIIRNVIESGTPQIIEDASMDQAFNMAQSILVSNVKAAICAPLVSHTRTIGALYADYPGKASLYSKADLEFFGAFANFAAVAIENARMNEELRERERLQRDLEIAAEIQQGLLPDTEFEVEGIDADWAYWPSKQVGGDFYDCVIAEDGRVALLLGDVSGKSIGAALFMARLMSALRATIPDDPSPAKVFTRANRLLGSRANRVFFATACYILLDPATRSIQYASAGHNPPLILDANTDEFRELPALDMPLGIDTTLTYCDRSETLSEGSLLLLYTDGIVEARDVQGQLFGLDATKDLILANRDSTPKDLIATLISAVQNHCQNSDFVRDDIALMVVKL